MPNRLAGETSPYLLQHQNNPVDWYPWGPEALDRAKTEEKPIFLSIGYSACHWCHVMEHESFEDEGIAGFLNNRFVCIKVDREERPDLDQIYMNAVQTMTGSGGWPMSVFLTPDLRPFFGGTYWPPQPRMGAAGFVQVIEAVDRFWQEKRGDAEAQAEKLTAHLQESFDGVPTTAIEAGQLHSAVSKLAEQFDTTNGGFGTRPKFPHPMSLQFMLRMWQRTGQKGLRDMVRLNLDKMARGGIYDHLGGGFARYSVDERWLVPHFEKMLYDNGLLTQAYLDGLLVTGDLAYETVVRETLDYVLRDMTDAGGGFHSTEDADSEGEEGKFYVWTPAQVRDALGKERGERFCTVYDVSERGNFEGKNILNLPKTIEQCAELNGWDVGELRSELADSRRRLLEVRSQRVRPAKDDKILLSWNALMIDAMARAGSVLGESRYVDGAIRAAEFLLAELRREDGRLLHCWRRGQAKFDAYLDDYAYLVNALVTLYEATFDETWIDRAAELAELMLRHFGDHQNGGLFYTADDHERLIARNKDLHDSSVPSGNSMAATALLRLGRLCGRPDWLAAAEAIVGTVAGLLQHIPAAMGQMLCAADRLVGPLQELVLVGPKSADQTPETVALFRKAYLPNCVMAHRRSADDGASERMQDLFAGKPQAGEQIAVFLCQDAQCQQPAIGAEAASRLLDDLSPNHSRRVLSRSLEGP